MRRAVVGAAIVLAVAALWWTAFVGLPRWYAAPPVVPGAAAAEPGETPDRKIRATLFYVGENGVSLVSVDREAPLGDSPVEQARLLIEAQLQPAPAPLLQPIPDGAALRSVFLTDRGEAYVDMSPEISRNHPGGSLEELFTVYAIVNVLTVNLPAITSVQILVDGHEAETIAGHVDIRRPLVKNLSLLPQPEPAPGATAAPDAAATPAPPAPRP
jgi:Sporulation and spore germination